MSSLIIALLLLVGGLFMFRAWRARRRRHAVDEILREINAEIDRARKRHRRELARQNNKPWVNRTKGRLHDTLTRR